MVFKDKKIKLLFFAIFCLFIPLLAFAHEGHEKKIKHYNKLIKEEPHNAENYYLRGVQFQSHGDFKESRADFFKVLSLKHNHEYVKLNLAILYHEHMRLDSALLFIDEYILENPVSSKAYECKAGIFHEQKKYSLASDYYKEAINIEDRPGIELFFALSKAYEEAGDIENARNTIKEAMNVLGALIPLRESLVNIEARNLQWRDAHKILDTILEDANRKETWHVKKAELYLKEGNKSAAKAQFELALHELEKLPSNRRNSDFIHDLEMKIQQNIESLINSK